MWFYLIPLALIFYAGMAFVSGPIYIRLTQHRMGEDDYIGYTIAAVTWPVCLPVCLMFTGARATGGMWMKYIQFLQRYHKRTHPNMESTHMELYR